MRDQYDALMTLWAEEPLPTAREPTPVERADCAALRRDVRRLHTQSIKDLQAELLARIHTLPFQFFEQLIIEVLLAMGYGARHRDLARAVGKSGDGGIDGVIMQDALGLEPIYVQAKRLKPGVTTPVSDVRDFAGSLEAARASKGIFVTTGQFSAATEAFVASLGRRVALVDGQKLADLMIQHDLGVQVQETVQIKMIDLGYFAVQKLKRRE